MDAYTLTNAHGIKVKIITYGAAIASLETPDRTGRLANIVLGFDTLTPLSRRRSLFRRHRGTLRQPHRRRTLRPGRETYQLAHNDGPNSLHGGVKGFDKRAWTAAPSETAQAPDCG